MNLRGKHVLVLGLGLHGGAIGTIAWLLGQGARVTASDIKSEEELAATIEKIRALPGGDEVALALGGHSQEDILAADCIIRNPAVPRTSDYLQLAKQHNIPIEMDSSLFFEHCPSRDTIGITGSKGKTTTAHAIALVLKTAWKDTVQVGTDGVSPLGELASLTPRSPVVFELSSWRLEALNEKKISPATAVVTSIYRDHLNTYTSFDEYIDTKKTIIRHQTVNDTAIINYDDPRLRLWQDEVRGTLFWYSLTDIQEEGIFVREDMIIIRQKGREQSLFTIDTLPLTAKHEQRNMLPAILIGWLRGLTAEQLKTAIERVQALPHRLELVRELDGVSYINDSAATMPDATIAALQSLTRRPLLLILGGSDKALRFEALAQAVSRANVRAIVWLPGTATSMMQEAIQASGTAPPLSQAPDMPSAVRQVHDIAQPGDTVLLSPAATSFGLFQHEFDRGNQFRQAVLAL